jgi:hypothetical protein
MPTGPTGAANHEIAARKREKHEEHDRRCEDREEGGEMP